LEFRNQKGKNLMAHIQVPEGGLGKALPELADVLPRLQHPDSNRTRNDRDVGAFGTDCHWAEKLLAQ
jgi:hypothetical protein